jgi:hypothetical protein
MIFHDFTHLSQVASELPNASLEAPRKVRQRFAMSPSKTLLG